MRKRELERRLGEAEQRFYDWQSTVVPPWTGYSVASPYASTSASAGLPIVSAAIRLLSESLGMMPLKVYRGDPPDRETVRDSWQWTRLHDSPNDETSAFDFWQDVSTSVESAGNAYIWKAITRRPVQSAEDIQLLVMDPSTITVKRNGARKVFTVRRDGVDTTYGTDRILHVRGWTLVPGAVAGVSPIALHRESLGKYLATEEFESRFFSNNGRPSGVIQVPGDPKPGDVDELRRLWFERYGGLQNAHTPAILTNGATWQSVGLSLQDAQFIEQKHYSLADVARIFRISAVGLLGAYAQSQRTAPSVDEDLHRFLQVDMNPRIDRVQHALRTDTDLFPSRDLFPEFETAAILRPDIATRFAAYKDAAQGGWMTGNEIRELENLPPHPDGETLQQTPVGGAPNPTTVGNGHAPVGQLAPME